MCMQKVLSARAARRPRPLSRCCCRRRCRRCRPRRRRRRRRLRRLRRRALAPRRVDCGRAPRAGGPREHCARRAAGRERADLADAGRARAAEAARHLGVPDPERAISAGPVARRLDCNGRRDVRDGRLLQEDGDAVAPDVVPGSIELAQHAGALALGERGDGRRRAGRHLDARAAAGQRAQEPGRGTRSPPTTAAASPSFHAAGEFRRELARP